jgi:hypothetical protein
MYFGIRLRHFRIEGLFIIPKMPKGVQVEAWSVL